MLGTEGSLAAKVGLLLYCYSSLVAHCAYVSKKSERTNKSAVHPSSLLYICTTDPTQVVGTLCAQFILHRGSYMSAHVLLNLLNEFRKGDRMRDYTGSSDLSQE